MNKLNEPVFRRFHNLMPHRVREVLLVSSPYDAFILEEDGNLTERIFDEYSELSLSSAPRVTHVKSAESALELMHYRRFDLVLAMMRLADVNVVEFGRQVKKLRPGKPVVLLNFDNPEVEKVGSLVDQQAIDMAFMWRGDAKILLAIIKFVEDQQNVDHDIEEADVRVIIMVEDSLRYYSSFLGMLYAELMAQSSSLYSEGVNRLHKLMHMRARPKVLLARTYEQAIDLYDRYEKNVLAIISDVGYIRKGKQDRHAGIDFIKRIRKQGGDIPVLMQSANAEFHDEAIELGAQFVNKNSPTLLQDIRSFLINNLGFGPFVFRLPDGQEVGRAHDVRELERVLKEMPAESLHYHAHANHISIWLMARSEFRLAQQLRPRRVSDFNNIEDVRHFILETLRISRERYRRGVIGEYKRSRLEPENRFLRIGDGSVGGKARGIAFINARLQPENLADKYEDFAIQVPQTLVLCTDWFDRFMSENNLSEFAYESSDDGEIISAFLTGQIPWELREELRFILEAFRFPLAVRSSSLLEDDQYQPFAGIYETYMLANGGQDIEQRLEELSCAIKLVFASTFKQNAKAYIENTARRIEEEKMAIVIQRLIGQGYQERFYPTFSGVVQSYNYYPIGHQKSEDGIAMVALGLGRMVVDGGQALRFCPRYPQILPQFSSAKAIFQYSQRSFWALDLTRQLECSPMDPLATLESHTLEEAEKDGTLNAVGGVYNAADDRIGDSLDQPGPRVVTFNNLLKYKAIPLAPALAELLQLCRIGMGCEVEIEFACDMGDWGRSVQRGRERVLPNLSVLQLRPIVIDTGFENHPHHEYPVEQCLCRSDMVLGHGLFDSIHDIIYVKREAFDPAQSPRIARQIGRINEKLKKRSASYILIGPGRWGSADPWLGIPVQWAQISSARIIVEASPEGYNVDPSQGTHFFQNITSLRIGYLTIPPGSKAQSDAQFVDWDFMDGFPAQNETEFLRHIHAEKPFVVHIDGRKEQGVITKPGVAVDPTENGM